MVYTIPQQTIHVDPLSNKLFKSTHHSRCQFWKSRCRPWKHRFPWRKRVKHVKFARPKGNCCGNDVGKWPLDNRAELVETSCTFVWIAFDDMSSKSATWLKWLRLILRCKSSLDLPHRFTPLLCAFQKQTICSIALHIYIYIYQELITYCAYI